MTIRVQNLSLIVGERTLLRDSTFAMADSRLTVLIGKSGGGKSSFLRVLAGLEKRHDPHARIRWTGSIHWEDGGQSRDLWEHHRVGLVFQHPALLDELSAIENVQLALDHRDVQRSPSVEDHRKDPHDSARWWLEHLHVPTDVPIGRLSGGQRQRLSLAQVLASKPSLLIYDEPTTGLDRGTASRVAALIRQIQQEESIPSIVVTHDYQSFLPHADHWLLLDTDQKQIITTDAERVGEEVSDEKPREHRDEEPIKPGEAKETSSVRGGSESSSPMAPRLGIADVLRVIPTSSIRYFERIGGIVESVAWGLIGGLRPFPTTRWGMRFLRHYAGLVFGPTAIVYLMISGGIIGFVSTYFTLRYLPYKVYTEPLLMEELLGVIGFALYRILIPITTSLLVAARCSAAVAADLGNKRYGGQYESLELLGASPHRYWLPAVVWNFAFGILFLNACAYQAASLTSLIVHRMMQPKLGLAYWKHYYHLPIQEHDTWLFVGWHWLGLKLLLSGIGTALVTYRIAVQPKNMARDVSYAITRTILWSTLWVLFVHMMMAFVEF